MNVHPIEALDDLLRGLGEHAAAVRDRIRPSRPFAVGLWLSNAATLELEDPARLHALRCALEAHELEAFSANIFPFGGFHEASVKREVYRPTWADPRRRDYSLRAARQLAALLPDERPFGTLSTSPLSYKAFADEAERPAMIRHLVELAGALMVLEAETGRELCLALEPEPLATLETSAETARFFQEELFEEGAAALAEAHSLTRASAREALRRHIGVCFDTCHLACEWEDLRGAVGRLVEAGVRIAKAQLSVALELRDPARNPEGVARLRSFAEPRYLHQTLSDAGLYAEDISELFGPDGQLLEPWREAEALRSHFHVPSFWDGDEALGTTRHTLEGVVPALLEAGCRHFEVETYSWGVIPEPVRASMGLDLHGMLALELQVARELFPIDPLSP